MTYGFNKTSVRAFLLINWINKKIFFLELNELGFLKLPFSFKEQIIFSLQIKSFYFKFFKWAAERNTLKIS